MNNKNLQKILSDLALEKQFAINKANNNLQNAMDNKEYSELEYNLRSLAFDIAKKELGKIDNKQDKEKYNILYKKQTALLKDLGYTREDLQPNFSCKLCNDTGYNNGKLCECVYKRYNELIKKQSSYSNIINYHFSDFSNDIYNNPNEKANMTKLYKACKKFTEDFPNTNKTNLIFTGPVGVGKTYLISAIANELIEKNHFVNYLTAFELNQIFLKYHLADIKDKNDILDNLLNCDVLIIDDLGTEQIINKVTIEYMFLLLNERAIKNKHIIVSTNLTLNEILDRYGERIFSRLFDKRKAQVIGINNIDLRLKNN